MNRLLGFVYAAFAIALLLYASGCGPTLMAQSAPPPGRIASLGEDDGKYELDLSSGVAIAISCTDQRGPCKDVVIATEDESIAEVKGAAFGVLEKDAYTGATAGSAGVVIVGKKPGTTKVKIKTSDGSRTIKVTVLAPPATGSHSTAVARP